nr:7634_t:CDS:2 [Entrophospora candida]
MTDYTTFIDPLDLILQDFSTDQVDDNNKTKQCQLCKLENWKYKCPKCEMKTCSLGCVKEHKVKFGCDGVRKKTIYIDIEKYGYKDLMSARRLRLDKSTKK